MARCADRRRRDRCRDLRCVLCWRVLLDRAASVLGQWMAAAMINRGMKGMPMNRIITSLILVLVAAVQMTWAEHKAATTSSTATTQPTHKKTVDSFYIDVGPSFSNNKSGVGGIGIYVSVANISDKKLSDVTIRVRSVARGDVVALQQIPVLVQHGSVDINVPLGLKVSKDLSRRDVEIVTNDLQFEIDFIRPPSTNPIHATANGKK